MALQSRPNRSATPKALIQALKRGFRRVEQEAERNDPDAAASELTTVYMTEFEPLERYLLGAVRRLSGRWKSSSTRFAAIWPRDSRERSCRLALTRLGRGSRDPDRPARGPADRDVRAGVLRVARHDPAGRGRGHSGRDHAACPGGQGRRSGGRSPRWKLRPRPGLEHCGRLVGRGVGRARPALPPRWP